MNTTTTKPMMACGHAANATYQGRPCCSICFGLHVGAMTVVNTPDLSTRQASCTYCHRLLPSSTDLPFFTTRPTKETDEFYCGCRGWD